MNEQRILVVNTGSSSLKLGLYLHSEGEETLLFDALADGIGRDQGSLTVSDGKGNTVRQEAQHHATQKDSLRTATQWFAEMGAGSPAAIGHRVVHGGPKLVTHQAISPAVLQELRACLHFAPLHIPMALDLIEASEHAYPGIPQFACFDTAFHNTMPEAAKRLALPRDLFDEGIRRYGFHGLSYESIVYQLGKDLPRKTVMAHLGSGASLAAVEQGRSVDTSMGLTPTGGIPMGTRCGDLDPGVLLYLIQAKQATGESLEAMLNHEAGLKAVSGGEADLRALEKNVDAGDQKAAMALEIFCRAIAKTVAGYATVLDGLELLVFAGGIGEHSARVRREVCAKLGVLGIAIDEGKNLAHAEILSDAQSRAMVRIVASEEDRQIARHVRRML